jgi:hypothetical protein
MINLSLALISLTVLRTDSLRNPVQQLPKRVRAPTPPTALARFLSRGGAADKSVRASGTTYEWI